MASPKKLIILGTGGNSVDILDAVYERNAYAKIPPYECIGFLDDDQQQWGKEIWGVQVLGGRSAFVVVPLPNGAILRSGCLPLSKRFPA